MSRHAGVALGVTSSVAASKYVQSSTYMTSVAERVGFEPTVRIATYTRFPGVRLKPLIHLSESRFYQTHMLSRQGRRERDSNRGAAEDRWNRCASILTPKSPATSRNAHTADR